MLAGLDNSRPQARWVRGSPHSADNWNRAARSAAAWWSDAGSFAVRGTRGAQSRRIELGCTWPRRTQVTRDRRDRPVGWWYAAASHSLGYLRPSLPAGLLLGDLNDPAQTQAARADAWPKVLGFIRAVAAE